jgi:serine/threonine-protein kinase
MTDPHSPAVRLATLLASDLVDSTRLVGRLGDERAAEVLRRHDRIARDLIAETGGREIDKTDGFLLTFGRPTDAVSYALQYHEALARLSREVDERLEARIGIHVGEVVERRNDPADVARGAKPVEVEGLAKSVVARLMSLAGPGQTLLTRSPFDLARRGVLGTRLAGQELSWLAHGAYVAKGLDEPLEVFEVGRPGQAPLVAPAETEKVRQRLDPDAIVGWRPASGVEIPGRPNWVLQEKAGAGGFGEVWRAEHKKTGENRVYKFCYDLIRLKALKREVTLVRLLKEELGDRRDIARIIDWNFDHTPYYIESEWTEAGSLDRWMAESAGPAVPLEVRAEIIAQVADALAAAHSVGVLHKDIKPSNILMTGDGNEAPQIKLTDFGIGLITDKERLERAGITTVGLTSVGEDDTSGTHLYMAPELLEGKPATVHADVYALGVVLYQFVIGDFKRALSEGWERDIADPLIRDDITAAVEGRPDRRIDIRRLSQRLRRLRARRVELEHQQRLAARAIKTRKVRTVAALAAAGLVLVVVATGIQLRRVGQERDRANRAAVTSQRVSDFMTGLFRLADPGEAAGNTVTAREILDQGARQIDSQLVEEPEIQATLMATMGNVYLGLGLARDAKPIIEKSLEIKRRVFGTDAAETGDGQYLLGEAEFAVGNYPGAEASFAEALRIRTRLDGAQSPRVAQALEGLGRAQWRRGHLDEAARAVEQGVAIYRATPGHAADLAVTLSRLASIRFSSGKYGEADTLLREALALTRQVHGAESRLTAQMMNNLGLALTAERRLDEAGGFLHDAVALYKKLLGNDHPLVASAAWSLGTLRQQQKRLSEAEALLREAVAIQEIRYGREHLETSGGRVGLAWVLADAGKCREAEPIVRDAIQVLNRIHPDGHWIVEFGRSILGECLAARGLAAEAESLLVSSYPIVQRQQGGPWGRAALERVISFYERRGNSARAEEYRKLRPPS